MISHALIKLIPWCLGILTLTLIVVGIRDGADHRYVDAALILAVITYLSVIVTDPIGADK